VRERTSQGGSSKNRRRLWGQCGVVGVRAGGVRACRSEGKEKSGARGRWSERESEALSFRPKKLDAPVCSSFRERIRTAPSPSLPPAPTWPFVPPAWPDSHGEGRKARIERANGGSRWFGFRKKRLLRVDPWGCDLTEVERR